MRRMRRYDELMQVAHAFGFVLTPMRKGIVGEKDGWRCVINSDPSKEWLFYKGNSRWGGDTAFSFAALLHQKTRFDFDRDLLPASFGLSRKPND